LYRTQARWDKAEQGYALGLEEATRRDDRQGMLLGRLGLAKVLFGRGNLPEARRRIEEIIAEAEGPELADVRAWGYADLAMVLERLGIDDRSLEALLEAFRHYRDSHERLRVLGSLGVGLRRHRAFAAARQAFETVREHSSQWQVRQNAVIELMALAGDTQDELAFRRYKTEAEEGVERMPPAMLVDFYLKLGEGLLRFGRNAHGVTALRRARDVAELHGLNETYFRVDRMIAEAGAHERRERDGARPGEVEPAVAAVAEKLLALVGG
jgi:tetratricopeptide (TPR) repeat protein